MRNVYSRQSDPNEFVTCCGEDEHVIFSAKVLKDGSITLEPSGSESMSEKINAWKDSTDIAYMVNQIMLGNTDVLDDRKVYMDFTKLPKTYAEVLQLQIDAEKAFFGLPVDLRKKYDNDFHQWLALAGTDEWMKDFVKPEQDTAQAVKDTAQAGESEDVKE